MNVSNLKIFLISFCIFVLSDMIYLGFLAKPLYFKYYQPWLNIVDGQLQLLWWAAAVVYVFFALGVVFLIHPLAQAQVYSAAGYGAFLGLMIYAVYNFTCLAVFKDFPIAMGVLDSIWGSILYAWTSALTTWIVKFF